MTVGHTVDGVCERVRRDALLGVFGPVYTLASDVTADATSLVTVEEPSHMVVGTTLAVDYELYRVTDVNLASKTLTVVPGVYASTSASHSTGAVIEVSPRVPKAALLDWVEFEVTSWLPQLWRTKTLSLTVSSSERTYDLTGVDEEGVTFLLEVRQAPLSATTDDWVGSWSGDAWPRVSARLLRDMPTADFASGYALQLKDYPRSATTLRVAYASPFDTDVITGTTNLINTVGLEHGHLDVLEHALRFRALSSGLVGRTDWRASGMTRDSEQVTLLDVVRATDMARSLRDRRFNEEALALRSRWPYLSR